MKKILKIFLIILITALIIISFILGITTIVKYIKLSNIYKKIDKYIAYDNFYLKTTQIIDNETTETEAYYRNGKSKQIASNGIYTWTDGERAYLVDEENITIYTLSLEKNFALVSYNMFASPIQGYNYNFINKLLLAGDINTTIKKETIDGNDYYCIKTKENSAIKKVWIEKNSSKIKKATIIFSNGDVFNYEYELLFNSVKASEVSLPDITGYKLISGETGTILSENFNQTTSIENTQTTENVQAINEITIDNYLKETN